MVLHRAARRLPVPLAAWAQLAVIAVAGGCAAVPPRAPPSQVLVEVLPGDAELQLDGVAAGRGGRVVPLPELGRTYRLRASAPGFEPAERVDSGAQLVGARVALALRPAGIPGTGPIDIDDGDALAVAAEALWRRGQRAIAQQYADRAAAAAPDAPRVRRILEQLGGGGAERSIEVRRASPGSDR